MQKFERFIIYPMLFISLFFSFAGEDVQQTIAQQIHDEIIAKNIKIVDDKGNILIELKNYNNNGSGQIRIQSNNYEKDKSKINLYVRKMKEINDQKIYFSPFVEITSKYKNSNKYDYYSSGYSSRGFSTGYIGYNYKQSEQIFNLRDNELRIYNEKGDESIYIGQDKNGHGLINIYDKYGEDWRSYSFR